MVLPKDDVAFLEELGLSWRTEPDCGQAGFLIIDGFDTSGGGFTPPQTTLMVRIPALYNTTPLDMWYCDPPILLGGSNPVNTEAREVFLGRTWQRFSRHLSPGSWRPGKDGLRSFFRFIFIELQGKAG